MTSTKKQVKGINPSINNKQAHSRNSRFDSKSIKTTRHPAKNTTSKEANAQQLSRPLFVVQPSRNRQKPTTTPILLDTTRSKNPVGQKKKKITETAAPKKQMPSTGTKSMEGYHMYGGSLLFFVVSIERRVYYTEKYRKIPRRRVGTSFVACLSSGASRTWIQDDCCCADRTSRHTQQYTWPLERHTPE